MGAILTLVRKDLRQRIRDRSALLLAFVAPILLALVLSNALSGGDDFAPTFTLVDEDESEVSAGLVSALTSGSDIAMEATPSLRAAEGAVEMGDASAAIVIPAGFGDAVARGALPQLTVLVATDRPVAAAIARSIAEGLVARIAASQRAVVTTFLLRGTPPDPASAADLARRSSAAPPPIGVSSAEVDAMGASAASYYAPAMAVFFLFFTVQFGARSLLAERQDGTLARLLASPLRRTGIVAAKALSSFVLGVVSMVVVIIVTSLALGANWGDPAGVAVLTIAIVFAAMGVTALVATLARTPNQADGYSSAVATTLALLGGNFIALSQAPAFLQALSKLTPNGWALRGYSDLAFDGVGVSGVLAEAAAAAAFGIVTGGLALIRARRIVSVQ